MIYWPFIVAGLMACFMGTMFYLASRANKLEGYNHMETRLVEAGILAATPPAAPNCSECVHYETALREGVGGHLRYVHSCHLTGQLRYTELSLMQLSAKPRCQFERIAETGRPERPGFPFPPQGSTANTCQTCIFFIREEVEGLNTDGRCHCRGELPHYVDPDNRRVTSGWYACGSYRGNGGDGLKCSDCASGQTDACSYWRTQKIYIPHADICNEYKDLGYSRMALSVPHQRHCVTCRHRMSPVGQGFESIVCNRRNCRVTPARGLDCNLWAIRRRGEEEYETVEALVNVVLPKASPKPELKARTIVRI